MLSWRTRFGSVAAIMGAAACALAASAATAGATTIGANSPLATGSECGVTFTTAGQGAVWLDSTYTVPAGGGQISSFAFQNDGQNAGDVLAFAVMRPFLNVWVVVGQTGLNTLGSDSSLDTFFPTQPILAAAGDVIGFFLQDTVANQQTILHDCAVVGSGDIHVTQVAPGSGPPILGAGVVDKGTFGSGEALNLSAQEGGTGPDLVGAGVTNPSTGAANLFSLTAISAGGGSGTLTFTTSNGGTRVFGGTITCIDRVDNAATITAVDLTTGLADHAQVLDGGTSGPDKLINTMWDPSKYRAAQNARLGACTAPDTTKLANAPALGGDYIQFTGTTPGL